MAYTKINWEDLPSTDTPITSENLGHMEDGIEEAHNLIDEIKDAEIYSTDEVKTNKVWIDGKPIYRKVFTINVTSNDDLRYNHNLTDLDKYWINQENSFIFNNDESLSINYYYSSSDWSRVWINGTQIRIRIGASNFGNRIAYIVVEYTKTTD